MFKNKKNLVFWQYIDFFSENNLWKFEDIFLIFSKKMYSFLKTHLKKLWKSSTKQNFYSYSTKLIITTTKQILLKQNGLFKETK